ncbi:hypothetical protein ACFL59_00720 [Planctomycetota bacterium]
MNPRDLGFALAACLLDGDGSTEIAERAPREAGAAIRTLLNSLDLEQLSARVDRMQESGGASLEGIHPTWLLSRLLEERQEVVEAVCRNLDDRTLAAILPELERFGRGKPAGGEGKTAFRKAFDGELIEQFRSRAFPDLGCPAEPPSQPELSWIMTASPREVVHVGRECGLRAVARAFARIAREDLAKLCHGLAAHDSVRLVGQVVELNEELNAEQLRATQATHLRLLKSAGISPELFEDTGLAFLGAAAVSRLPEGTRVELCYKLPEHIGTRLLELSAQGALPEESAIEVYQKELREWLAEWKEKGLLKG